MTQGEQNYREHQFRIEHRQREKENALISVEHAIEALWEATETEEGCFVPRIERIQYCENVLRSNLREVIEEC